MLYFLINFEHISQEPTKIGILFTILTIIIYICFDLLLNNFLNLQFIIACFSACTVYLLGS